MQQRRHPTVTAVAVLAALASLVPTACGPGSPPRPDASETTAPLPPGSPAQPPAADAPEGTDVLTEADDGRTVRLPVGGEVALRLSSDWTWSQPRVEGEAVELVPVDHFADPGFVEWLVTAVEAGTATLTSRGTPACSDEAACPPTTVTLRLEVGEGGRPPSGPPSPSPETS